MQSEAAGTPDYFYRLELEVQAMRKHIVRDLRHLYTIAFEKGECARPPNGGVLCEWCASRPQRGSYSFDKNLRNNVTCPPSSCAEGDLCRHAVNRNLIVVTKQLVAVTPPDFKVVHKCGLCRRPGHNRRTCPSNTENEAANVQQADGGGAEARADDEDSDSEEDGDADDENDERDSENDAEDDAED
jgi:hypothetical protein